MKATELAVKIESLPENFRLMAEEYIQYLLQKASNDAIAEEKLKEIVNKRAVVAEEDVKYNRLHSIEEVRKDFRDKLSQLGE